MTSEFFNSHRPMHSSTLVCDRKFGQMWISTQDAVGMDLGSNGMKNPGFWEPGFFLVAR
jgi:hypothetical protein